MPTKRRARKKHKGQRKLTNERLKHILHKLDSVEETPANASKIRAIENQIDYLLRKR